MHVMGLGSGLAIFNSTLILPLSGCDVCPSEAPRSGVKSKGSMKKPYIHVVSYLETRVQVMIT